MSYNNKNRLRRIKDIQELYLIHKKEGVSTRHVYKTYIYPVYKISMATLYNYLAVNARKELKQYDLFPDEQ
jgi:hypothetical protein